MELQEWLSVIVMHYCLTGIDGLYNPLLLGAVKDTEDLTASAMDFAPGMGLNPLLDSWNGFGAVISESAFGVADFECSEFPHISKIVLQLGLQMSSVRSTRMFRTTPTMSSSAVYGIRMLLDA